MGKEKTIVIWILSLFWVAITYYGYAIDDAVNDSYLENYFFNSGPNGHFFAFSKNQYFEITPNELKIWVWNPIKNSYCEPVEIHFINAGSNIILGSEKSDIAYSYYSGKDPDHWIIGDYAYKKLCIPNIYNGIDLEFYFKGYELEFDFLVNPQANINQIIWDIRGNIDSYIEDNRLHIVNKEGYIYTFNIPEIYQSIIKNPNSIVSEHNASFSILDKHTYQITIDGLDRNSELVIDPILTLSTYIIIPSANKPSSLFDRTYVDYYKNIVDIAVIGGTINLPGTMGTTLSGFLCKISPKLGKTYQIVFINGDKDDVINTINHYTSSMDNFVILGGKTNSSNFPIINPIPPYDRLLNGNDTSTYFDGFLMVFDKDLRIVFSTFIGGMGDDSIDDITINNNNLCFAGNTNSIDLPFVNSSINYTKEIITDGFWGVLRLTDPLEYRYLTKLGIESIEIKNIEANVSSIYLCGNTTVGLPYFNPVIPETPVQEKDIFVQTYSYVDGTTTPDVSLLSSIFFGGSKDDMVEGAILIYSNTLCLAGNTYSNDIPGPIMSDIPEQDLEHSKPFITLVNPNASEKLVGTHYIFGDGIDVITDIKTPNENRNVFFISGYSNSHFDSFVWDNVSFTNNPFRTSLNQGMNNVNLDAMIWRLQWDSIYKTISTTWGTFLGGTGNDTVLSIGVADTNNICFSGITDSPDFPLQGCQFIAPAYLPIQYFSVFNISGKVIYVNPESTASPMDGSSWLRGFHTISEALNSANNHDEIWIKAGEYHETLTIRELLNVKLRGGFLDNEYNIDSQDPWAKPTKIIPIPQKGTGDLETPILNITASMGIEINGLIFENGNNIIGDGGAIHISNSLVNIVSSQFYANKAYGAGGAVYVDSSYAELINCVFVNNSCQTNGSAVSANESTLKIIHCSFANNRNTTPSIEISTVDIQGLTSMLMVLNSIIWTKAGNSQVQVNYPENLSPTNLLFSHSIIQNFRLLSSPPPSSETILDTDPLFIENPTETTKGDLNLSIESPAVNLSDTISLSIEYGAINEDIRRKPRILMGETCKPDAGAFEIFPPPPPRITLFGDNPLYIPVNNLYIEPGYEAKDGCDTDISFLVDIDSNLNTEQVGEYTIEYSVMSPYNQGQVVKVTRTVKVMSAIDQIILNGQSDIVLECGSFFHDPGAVAFDSQGNDISNEIIVEGNVDYNSPGTYSIEYRVEATETHSSLSVVRNITVQDTEPPILVLIGPQQITVPCGSTWSEPGYIASDKCSLNNVIVNVTGSVNTFTTGTYDIVYTAYDAYEHSSVLTRRVIVDCNIPQLQQCINQCSNDTLKIDEDGDGLTQCVENCLETSDQKTDTDEDGMPDYFETEYAFNPSFNDSKEDADFDGLLNIEEFLLRSNPKDSNSPWHANYVSTLGDDNNPGTLSSPRATIAITLADIITNISIQQNKQSIVLFPGDYYEDVELSENVILIGITAYGENNRAVIHGNIKGANNAKIFNIDIKPRSVSTVVIPPKAEVQNPSILLNCGNTAMHIRDVRFIGTGSETGISVEGGNPYNTIIERCLFQDLNIAILIGDSIPVIRRCVFKSTLSTKSNTQVGIYIEDNSGSSNLSNSLGDINDPNTGWNTFNLEGGKAIVSEREDEIKAHNNDWGTEDTGEILNQVQGNLDTQYYLGKGKAMIASSLVCVVWNATKRDPILNATVTISPSVYPPLTQNTEGVYTFPSIPDGTYTVRITAPNFDTRQIITNVPKGELKSESVALKPTTSVEGEGSVEGNPEGTPEGAVEGESNVTIPDVKGKSREEATQILINAGLRVSSTVKEEYSNEVPKGKVIRTEPAIGSDVAKNTEVVLVISKGAKRRFIISCGSTYNRDSYFGDIVILLFVSTLFLYRRKRENHINN